MSNDNDWLSQVIDEMQTLREENARLKAINHTMNSDYCKEDARLRAICDDLTAKLALAVEALRFTLKGLEMWRKYQSPGNVAEVEQKVRETLEKIK